MSARSSIRAFVWAVTALGLAALLMSATSAAGGADGTWTHHVEISVPFRDADRNGQNDYDPQFELEVTHSVGNCRETTLSPRVGTSGSELLAVASEPGFVAGCEVVTVFPPTIDSGVQNIELLRVGDPGRGTTQHERTARVTYTDGRSTFHPRVVLGGFSPEHSGATFELRFTPTGGHFPEACRLHRNFDHETWQIDDRGTAVRLTRATLMDTEARGGRCQYGITWPNIEGYIKPSHRVLSVTAGSPTVAGTYRPRSDRTTFSPNALLVVPWADYDDDGAHDLAGGSIAVTYDRASGQPQACSNDVRVTYTITGTSAPAAHYRLDEARHLLLPKRATFRTTPSRVRLTDNPNDSNHACVYDVLFASGGAAASSAASSATDSPAVDQLERVVDPASDDTSVSADDVVALGWYRNIATSAQVTLAVAAGAQADGQTFAVGVAPAAGSHGGCSGASTQRMMVGADGTASASLTLVDWPAGHDSPDDRCEYTVTWPDAEDGAASLFRRIGDPLVTIDASVFGQAEPTLYASYGTASTFAITVELTTTVPVTADTTFEVVIGPAAGAHRDCSRIGARSLTVLVGETSARYVADHIVDEPVGAAAECSYAVTWPTDPALIGDWVEDDSYSAKAVTLSASSSTATNRYRPVFDGEIEVRTTVPVSDHTTFTVPLNASPASCSAVQPAVVTVERGSAAARVVLARLASHGTDPTQPCRYAVSWPANEDGPGPHAWADDGAHSTFTASALEASQPRAVHQYRLTDDTTFVPDVRVTVPPLDGVTSGVNLFVGTAFTLTISRSPHSDPGCSAGTPISFDYTVQPDGTVTGDHPTPLVDSPGGTAATCAYAFAAENRKSAEPGAPLDWTLRLGAITSRVHSGSPRAVVAYSVGEITFVPQVDIDVPQIVGDMAADVGDAIDTGPIGSDVTNLFADAPLAGGDSGPLTFAVTFAPASGAPDGCSTPAAPTLYAIRPDGSVTGTPPALADRALTTEERNPGGSVQVGSPCAYEVTFPAQPTERPWLSRDTQSTSLTATSAASATYVATSIAAPVDLMVTTPGATPARSVAVTVATATGSSEQCLVDDLTTAPAATKTKQLTLDVARVTNLTRQFELTDLPAGATSANDRCAYDVSWSVTDLPVADAAWTLGTRDTAWRPGGRLGSPSELAAAYEVPAETSFDATLELTVVAHVPAGTAFVVTVDPAATSPIDCSPQTSRTLIAPALDGDNDRTITEQFSLLHTPAGVVGHCEYTVSWPRSETGGSAFAPDSAHTPDTELSQVRPTATNRYSDEDVATNFRASLTVSTAEPVAASTDFAVAVVPQTGAGKPANCSTDGDQQLTLTAGSQSATAEFTLVRRPARATAECTYTVSWPRHETSGTAWVRDDTATAEAQLNAASVTATRRYAANLAYFEPSVAFVVPHVDFDGDGAHDYAGAQFSVTFASSDPSCSSATRAYELDAAGDVAAATAFRLIDEHATRKCDYTLSFWPTSSITPSGPLVRVAAASDDETLSADGDDAQVTYEETVSRFNANLYLGGTHTLDGDDHANPIPLGTDFEVTLRPQASAPAGCDADPATDATSQTVTIAKSDVEERQPHTALTHVVVPGLIDRTASGKACVYDVAWPQHERDGSRFVRDTDPMRPFSDTVRGGTAADVGAVAWYRAQPAPAVVTPPPAPAVVTPPPVSGAGPGAGGSSARAGAGSSAGRSRGGSGGSTSGGSAVGPWVLAASSQVPVRVSLAMPEHSFAAGAAVEVLVNVPGTCGVDVSAFDGLAAQIGVTYALAAVSGATADVLAGAALTLAAYAERGDATRDCEVRVTLVSAPPGCELAVPRTDGAPTDPRTDDAGRSYVETTADASGTGFTQTATLRCDAPPQPQHQETLK